MAFTHAQFIAYEVPTAAALPAGNFELDRVDICAPVEKDDVFKESYATLSNDARARFARLLTLIDIVRRNEAARPQKSTLKVFMAPELYFRPQAGGAERSYASSDVVAIQAMSRLIFSQKMLSDWLVVLGSIVWNMKGKVLVSGSASGSAKQEEYLRKLQALADQDLVYNTALVGVGGVGLQVYDKVHYSEFDQVKRANWPTIQENNPKSSEASGIDSTVKGDKALRAELYDYLMRGGLRNTQCIVNTGNLHCGLEVCRDHACRLLAKGYETFQNSWANLNDSSPPPLDLQLLTACGMSVQKEAVVVGQKQYVFRLDGNTAPAELNGRFDHSEIQVVKAVDQFGRRTMVNFDLAPNEWGALNKPEVDLTLTGNLALDVTGATGFKLTGKQEELEFKEVPLDEVFKQRLIVYPQVALSHLAAH